MNPRLLIAIVVAATLLTAYFILKPDVRSGKAIFKGEGCTKCHTYRNVGFGAIDLSNVARRRSDVWLRDQIRNPKLHDPKAGMPSFSYLSKQEIDALIKFLHGDGD